MEYAVVERRLAPGRAAEYLEATAAFAEALRGARGYLAARSYLSEEDPDSALEVSRWLRRADRAAAMPNVPADRQDRLDALSCEQSSVRWFSAAREITTF